MTGSSWGHATTCVSWWYQTGLQFVMLALLPLLAYLPQVLSCTGFHRPSLSVSNGHEGGHWRCTLWSRIWCFIGEDTSSVLGGTKPDCCWNCNQGTCRSAHVWRKSYENSQEGRMQSQKPGKSRWKHKYLLWHSVLWKETRQSQVDHSVMTATLSTGKSIG